MDNQNEIENIGFKSKKLIKAYIIYTICFSLLFISFLIAEVFLYDNISFSMLFIVVVIISASMLIISLRKLLQTKGLPDALIKVDNTYLYFWHKGKYEHMELKKIENLYCISHFINYKGNSSISGDGILKIKTHYHQYQIDFVVLVYDVIYIINKKRNVRIA